MTDAVTDKRINNAGQQDADQAQRVADNARGRASDLSEDSEKPRNTDAGLVIPDDKPDLVDKMEEMDASGHIDRDAFAGEPEHGDRDNGRTGAAQRGDK